MKLITKEIEKKIPALYATDGTKEKDVAVKFFTPWSNWTWYVVEGEKMENGDWEFFGLVEGHHSELGYFRLSDLTSVKGPFGLTIERDRNYEGKIIDGKVA
jgi:hypothetical protein